MGDTCPGAALLGQTAKGRVLDLDAVAEWASQADASDRTALLERLRKMRTAGMTFAATADQLNDDGTPTVSGRGAVDSARTASPAEGFGGPARTPE